MNRYKLIGITLGLIAFTLAWVWFSWKLALVLFILLWGRNMEKSVRNETKEVIEDVKPTPAKKSNFRERLEKLAEERKIK